MALTVATNTGALMAQAAASSVNKEMEISMERLSTGKRINSAADDAAGVAIASRLSSEIRGTNQAVRNAMDAQALIDTAEGAHNEVENILQRMRDLAVQAANDTNNSTDRTNLSAEMTQLTTEITRIAATTKWAGQGLLNGTASTATVATATTDIATFNFQIGSGTASQDQLTMNIKAMTAAALGVAGSGTQATLTNITQTDGATNNITAAADLMVVSSTANSHTLTFGSGATSAISAAGVYSLTIQGTAVTITVSTGDAFTDDGQGVAKQMAEAIIAAGVVGLTSTLSTNTITLSMGGSLSLSNATNARSAISTIDNAVTTLNTQRANLGGISNRLDNTVNNLTNISNNLQSGRGRIEDADFAAETTALAKAQILQQASTAMLAQANAAKQNVLSLLQG
jgi:flagellin